MSQVASNCARTDKRMHALGLLFCALLCALASSPTARAENYSDLWWNPDESGWGLALADHETQLFGVWYTYGADGSPIWYVIPGGTLSADKRKFAGDIYQTTGPAWFSQFDPAKVTTTRVGTASIDFAPTGMV